jgi:hypothetical protein
MLRSDHSNYKDAYKLFPDSIWRDRWDMVWFIALLYNGIKAPFMLGMVPDWVNSDGSCMVIYSIITFDLVVRLMISDISPQPTLSSYCNYKLYKSYLTG